MRLAGKTLIAAALVVASATSAFATDLYVAPADPVMAAEPETDWGGLYVGKLGLATFAFIPDQVDPMFGVAKVVGFNYDAGNIIFGAEAIVGYYWPQTDTAIPLGPVGDQVLLEGNARVGVEVGDSALIYALAGVGTLQRLSGFGPSPLNFATVGIGGEWMFGDGWAARAQYNYRMFPDFPGSYSHNFAVGVSKYFN